MSIVISSCNIQDSKVYWAYIQVVTFPLINSVVKRALYSLWLSFRNKISALTGGINSFEQGWGLVPWWASRLQQPGKWKHWHACKVLTLLLRKFTEFLWAYTWSKSSHIAVRKDAKTQGSRSLCPNDILQRISRSGYREAKTRPALWQRGSMRRIWIGKLKVQCLIQVPGRRLLVSVIKQHSNNWVKHACRPEAESIQNTTKRNSFFWFSQLSSGLSIPIIRCLLFSMNDRFSLFADWCLDFYCVGRQTYDASYKNKILSFTNLISDMVYGLIFGLFFPAR